MYYIRGLNLSILYLISPNTGYGQELANKENIVTVSLSLVSKLFLSSLAVTVYLPSCLSTCLTLLLVLSFSRFLLPKPKATTPGCPADVAGESCPPWRSPTAVRQSMKIK